MKKSSLSSFLRGSIFHLLKTVNVLVACPAHTHPRGAQETVSEPVAGLVLFDHVVVLLDSDGDYLDRFMYLRIELLTDAGDRFEPEPLHLRFEYIGCRADAFEQGFPIGLASLALLGGGYGALEIVESIEQARDYVSARSFEFLVKDALHPRPLLLSLSLQLRLSLAEPVRYIAHLALGLGPLLIGLFQLRLKLFDLWNHRLRLLRSRLNRSFIIDYIVFISRERFTFVLRLPFVIVQLLLLLRVRRIFTHFLIFGF
jgi:hypothetical protein